MNHEQQAKIHYGIDFAVVVAILSATVIRKIRLCPENQKTHHLWMRKTDQSWNGGIHGDCADHL